jgi:hypothetical protein
MLPSGDLRHCGGPEEASISFMDDDGIDLAVVSLSTPACTREIAPKRGLWRAAATNS